MNKKYDYVDAISYEVETDVVTGEYIHKGGCKRNKVETIYGTFVFYFADENLVFDREKTHQYILEQDRIYYPCIVKMLECKRKKHFPDIVVWAS